MLYPFALSSSECNSLTQSVDLLNQLPDYKARTKVLKESTALLEELGKFYQNQGDNFFDQLKGEEFIAVLDKLHEFLNPNLQEQLNKAGFETVSRFYFNSHERAKGKVLALKDLVAELTDTHTETINKPLVRPPQAAVKNPQEGVGIPFHRFDPASFTTYHPGFQSLVRFLMKRLS
jgi:hypothetical protein